MILDNIVRVTISSQSLRMSQAGFGTPLIILQHDYWEERVRTFSELSELTTTNEKYLQAWAKENKGVEKAKEVQISDKSALYLAASSLISQTPRVPKFKIGLRKPAESIASAINEISRADIDGDFYGIVLFNEHGSDHGKYREDIESLVSALKTKRLLAGVDLSKEQFEAFPKKEGKLDGLTCRRLFYLHKERDNEFPAAAWFGRMLPMPPGSSSWAFKELDYISKSKLSTDLTEKLKRADINRHIFINDKGVTLDGKVSSGEYIDIVHGINWLHVRIQERIFRLLMLNGKIPYTAKGVDLIRSELLSQLNEAVGRGLLAADPEPKVSIPDINAIPADIKEKRILPDVKFSARLAGAIHEIEINGTVSD